MNRIKLHVISSTQPATLMRVVRFLVARQIPIECGNQFVKFPRGEAPADAAAERLKELGFRPPALDRCPRGGDRCQSGRSGGGLSCSRAGRAGSQLLR